MQELPCVVCGRKQQDKAVLQADSAFILTVDSSCGKVLALPAAHSRRGEAHEGPREITRIYLHEL